MKILFKLTLSLSLMILMATCAQAQIFGKKSISGNNNITTKTVSTSDYDVIEVTGSMDVNLVHGNEGEIKVTTDDNIHEYIVIESENKKLVIKTKKGYSLKTKKGIKITVPFRDITDLELTGSGDIKTQDQINAGNFEVSLIGSGDIDIDIAATVIDAKVTGSGDLLMKGSVDELEVKLTGSGDFKGTGLIAKNTQAYVAGSGTAKVNATNRIKARVDGSGDVIYSGNPEYSDTKVMGSGTIKSN